MRAVMVCIASILGPAGSPADAQVIATPSSPAATVFAAASLSDAVTELGRRYQLETGRVLRLSFASSSTLARQIENGAAAEIFLSADEEWMVYLDERSLVVRDTWSRPIGNRLVLVAPADRAHSISLEKRADLLAHLGDGRLATGDPAHVPVGRYAREALEHLGSWSALEPRLARAENVRAALALVERGEAPLGIVYATDARAARSVRIVAEFPAASHAPIRYSFAILAGHERDEVRAVLAFLISARSLEVFRSHGFDVP